MSFKMDVKILENLISKLAPYNNYDVYKRRLKTDPSGNFQYTPYWAYFYYIYFDNVGRLKIRHYTYSETPPGDGLGEIEYSETKLTAIAQDLAQNARRGILDKLRENPEKDGENFENVVWNKKSYVIFFVDQPGWIFHDEDVKEPGVAFSAATPNHSFYDAMRLTVPMAKIDPTDDGSRTAIVLVNHMKHDDDGHDLEGHPTPVYDPKRRQKFEFALALDVHFANSTAAPVMVTIDPGGTNQGPPESP